MPKKDRPWEPAGQAGVLPLTWARVGEDFTLRSGVYTTLLAKNSVKIVLFLAGLPGVSALAVAFFVTLVAGSVPISEGEDQNKRKSKSKSQCVIIVKKKVEAADRQ